MLALLLLSALAFFAVVWLITFPVRLLMRLVFGVAGFLLRLLFTPIFLILAVVGIVIGIVVAIVSAVVHLIPLAIVALIGWGIYRMVCSRRPAVVERW